MKIERERENIYKKFCDMDDVYIEKNPNPGNDNIYNHKTDGGSYLFDVLYISLAIIIGTRGIYVIATDPSGKHNLFHVLFFLALGSLGIWYAWEHILYRPYVTQFGTKYLGVVTDTFQYRAWNGVRGSQGKQTYYGIVVRYRKKVTDDSGVVSECEDSVEVDGWWEDPAEFLENPYCSVYELKGLRKTHRIVSDIKRKGNENEKEE